MPGIATDYNQSDWIYGHIPKWTQLHMFGAVVLNVAQ